MKNIFNIKAAFTFILALSVFGKLSAQQNNLFNTYSYDLMQLNIASAGSKCIDANLNYRAQWVGLKDNPKVFQLNASMALGASSGIGLKVRQQNIGLLTFNNITAGYAYKINLGSSYKLRIGLGLSWQQNVFNSSKVVVVDASTPLPNSTQRANNFDTEAGALLLGDKLTLGLSANSIYNTNKSFGNEAYVLNQQINFVGAYKVYKGKSLTIEPWLLNRYSVKGVNQFEGMLNAKIVEIVTVGAGYRQAYGAIALIGVEKGNIKLVYSYDYNISKRISLGSSHQIMLGLNFCKREKVKPEAPKEPLYFIKLNNKEEGTYTMLQLQNMVKEGKIQRNTPVRGSEETVFVDAEKVPQLEPLFPPKVPTYFVNSGGKEEGAYAISQLQDMVRLDLIQRNTPVRNSNGTTFVDAEKMPELEPLFPRKETVYYATIDGKEQGTFTMKQLQDMAANGRLKRQSPVRKSTESASVAAGKVDVIIPYFPNAAEVKAVSNINSLASGLLFGNGKTVLTPDKKTLLDEIALEFKKHPELKVYIEGFASKTGNPEMNKILSQKRAEHVRQELIKRGVSAAQILGNKAYGSDKVDNSLSDDLNRAVHFQIIE